jgi:hypothetical protein
MIIKETKNYTLTIGKPSGSDANAAYLITNKKYGVVEVESYLLPQAIKHMGDLEAALQAQTDILEGATQ